VFLSFSIIERFDKTLLPEKLAAHRPVLPIGSAYMQLAGEEARTLHASIVDDTCTHDGQLATQEYTHEIKRSGRISQKVCIERICDENIA
jgi:hypothetical protein